MTHPPAGPDNPPPPPRPGKDLFGEYELQLATVGCEVIDPLAAAARAVAAGAPALTEAQRELGERIFAGGLR